jgi:hypothetical protein
VRAARRVFCPPAPQNVVFVLAQQVPKTSIIGPCACFIGSDRGKILFGEGECYDHSYGEQVSDHVEVVRLEPAGIRVEIPVEVETEHHVTTERLKGQFAERLAARGARRLRRAHP